MKNTNISFKGIYYRSTSSCYLDTAPKFNKLGQGHNCFRVKFSLEDDECGKDLSEFKHVIANTNLASLFRSYFFENVFLDIEKSNDPNDYGYSISLSGERVNQQDEKSLFKILTFLCAVTKQFMTQTDINQNSIRYIKLANNILDKVAKRAFYK